MSFCHFVRFLHGSLLRYDGTLFGVRLQDIRRRNVIHLLRKYDNAINILVIPLLRINRRLFVKDVSTLNLVLFPPTYNTNFQHNNGRSLRHNVQRRRHTGITTIRRRILFLYRVPLRFRRGNTRDQIYTRNENDRAYNLNTSNNTRVLFLWVGILFTLGKNRPRLSLKGRHISHYIILKILTHARNVRTSNTMRNANVRVGVTRFDHRATYRHEFTYAYEPISHGECRIMSLLFGLGSLG